jgi:hypothetical protein
MTDQELVRRALDDMRIRFRVESPDDVVVTEARGYWHMKAPCPGGDGCRHGSRAEMGPCDGSEVLSVDYSEHAVRGEEGRFVPPYRAWEAWRRLYPAKPECVAVT